MGIVIGIGILMRMGIMIRIGIFRAGSEAILYSNRFQRAFAIEA
jgi:hypothetical protein